MCRVTELTRNQMKLRVKIHTSIVMEPRQVLRESIDASKLVEEIRANLNPNYVSRSVTSHPHN